MTPTPSRSHESLPNTPLRMSPIVGQWADVDVDTITPSTPANTTTSPFEKENSSPMRSHSECSEGRRSSVQLGGAAQPEDALSSLKQRLREFKEVNRASNRQVGSQAPTQAGGRDDAEVAASVGSERPSSAGIAGQQRTAPTKKQTTPLSRPVRGQGSGVRSIPSPKPAGEALGAPTAAEIPPIALPPAHGRTATHLHNPSMTSTVYGVTPSGSFNSNLSVGGVSPPMVHQVSPGMFPMHPHGPQQPQCSHASMAWFPLLPPPTTSYDLLRDSTGSDTTFFSMMRRWYDRSMQRWPLVMASCPPVPYNNSPYVHLYPQEALQWATEVSEWYAHIRPSLLPRMAVEDDNGKAELRAQSSVPAYVAHRAQHGYSTPNNSPAMRPQASPQQQPQRQQNSGRSRWGGGRGDSRDERRRPRNSGGRQQNDRHRQEEGGKERARHY